MVDGDVAAFGWRGNAAKVLRRPSARSPNPALTFEWENPIRRHTWAIGRKRLRLDHQTTVNAGWVKGLTLKLVRPDWRARHFLREAIKTLIRCYLAGKR